MTPDNLSIPGLQHVTAITADAQKNIDFYRGVLGLRLVKLTVNFDDPSSYHLYYGDDRGRPGTIMTFFVWPGAFRGRIGPPQLTTTAFSVPLTAIDYWLRRLKEHGTNPQSEPDRFGDPVISFTDPDGMHLDIIGSPNPAGTPWPASPIPNEHAIRAFHSVTISLKDYAPTAKLLTQIMGFIPIGNDKNRFRFRAAGLPQDAFASTVDLLCLPDARPGSLGAGIVHHVAFRTPDDAQHQAALDQITRHGLNVSPIMDRIYFHSIYFREPGNVLFEIATDTPGFTADQSPDQLGTKLMLPPWLEPHRSQLELALPSNLNPKALQ